MQVLLPVFAALLAAATSRVWCADVPLRSHQLLALVKSEAPNPHSLHLFIQTHQDDPDEFDINCRDPDGEGRTPLMYTVDLPSQDCMRVFLAAANIDVDAEDGFGYTALHFACMPGGKPAAVGLLIDAGARLNVAEMDQGCTPLIFAAANGHLESVRLLIRAPGINVHKKSDIGNNALLACLAADDPPPNVLAIAELLLKEAKIDPFEANSNKKDAFQLAIEKKMPGVLRVLLEAVNPNKDEELPHLIEAYQSAIMAADREAALLIRQYGNADLTLATPEARRAEAALFPNGFQ
jgi:hypothetical protein